MTNKDPWWKKHTLYKSDPIIEMVEKSPEQFMISRTEILQLVLDFKSVKNKLSNMFMLQDAEDAAQAEWEALSEEEREQRKAQYKKVEEELKKVWDSEI